MCEIPFDFVAEVSFLRFLSLRQIKGITHDPLAASFGEYVFLHAHFEVSAFIHTSTDIGVFAFVVFADDIHINVTSLIAVHRQGNAGKQANRAQVDVLLKLAPDRY